MNDRSLAKKPFPLESGPTDLVNRLTNQCYHLLITRRKTPLLSLINLLIIASPIMATHFSKRRSRDAWIVDVPREFPSDVHRERLHWELGERFLIESLFRWLMQCHLPGPLHIGVTKTVALIRYTIDTLTSIMSRLLNDFY